MHIAGAAREAGHEAAEFDLERIPGCTNVPGEALEDITTKAGFMKATKTPAPNKYLPQFQEVHVPGPSFEIKNTLGFEFPYGVATAAAPRFVRKVGKLERGDAVGGNGG